MFWTQVACWDEAQSSTAKTGERGRNRTYNLVIKSHLLCQLSYAPGGGKLGKEKTPAINIACHGRSAMLALVHLFAVNPASIRHI